MTNSVTLGYEYFPDPVAGRPVANGSIYVGNIDTDPTIPGNQKSINVIQEDGTVVPVSQPVQTSAGGVPQYNGSPVTISAEEPYSLAVLNSLGSQVYYSNSSDNYSTKQNKTYTPDGTGAVARTVEGKLGESVSFKDFGAVGDGVADDGTAINDCLQYVVDNNLSITDYTGSTYLYTSNITITGANKSLRIATNCAFNGVNAYITLQGSITSIGNISAAATKGTDSFTASSVTGLATDDILILENDTNGSFSQHRNEYHDGEYVEIDGIAASVVTTKTPLLTSYTGVATDKVFKLNPLQVILIGGTFTSSGTASEALRVLYCGKTDIRPTTVASTGMTSALRVDRAYKTNVVGGFYNKNLSGSGNDYGINVVNSQAINIDKVYAYGGRHAITTGGDADDAAAPCRFVKITDSYLENDASASVYCADFHGNTADSYYEGCTIFGAIGLAGYDVGSLNNTVYCHDGSNDIPLSYQELAGGHCRFIDNRVVMGNSTATDVVGTTSSSLSANIDSTYKIIVKDLDVEMNATTQRIINAFENSSVNNSWILDGFAIDGTTTGLTEIVKFTNSTGTDATKIVITNPIDPEFSGVTWLVKSGTTLPNAVIELPFSEGSDANGNWTKFSDGTMICRFNYSDSQAINAAFLGGFRTGGLTWTYPQAFISDPEVSITPSDATCFSGVGSTISTTNALFFLTAITSQTAATRSAKLIAIGRWF